jgi:hypothetical protein
MVVEAQQNKIFQWYAMVSDIPTERIAAECQICTDEEHTVNGLIQRWWIEPLIKDVNNPVLEVCTLGDSWTCSLRAVRAPIKSYGGV